MPSFHKPDALSSDAGLLLVGHGTRYALGVEEFLSVVRQVAALADRRPVEPCFLEFAQPSIAAGFASLVERGAKCVVVAPVILFAAGHIRRDIPREVAAAAARCPGVSVAQAPHLGCHPALVQLSSQRYDEALASAPHISAEDTVLVMVGRGSRDREATEEMLHFAQLRQEMSRVGATHTAFLAMADPPLESELERLARLSPARIVVQPHLLFAGELLARVRSLVQRMSETFPATDWHVTEHLGPTDRVASAVLARASEAPCAPTSLS
jgi:sirohydrochlorin cobaltochelatase